jgi:hypothetical protein
MSKFMTPTERKIAENALVLLSDNFGSLSRADARMAADFAKLVEEELYGKIPAKWRVHDTVTAGVRKEINFRLVESTPGPALALLNILRAALAENKPFAEVMLEVYSHPDCVSYYKSRDGLWLLTIQVGHAMQNLLATSKEEIFDKVVAEDLNNIVDSLARIKAVKDAINNAREF